MFQPSLTEFIRQNLIYPDERLKRLYEEALKERFPVVEPEVGNLLRFFTLLLQPKTVVEFGSGFGYSALWIALSCKNCKIYCIDYQEKNRKRALDLFKTFGVEKKIEYLVGEAQTVFKQLGFERNSLDLIFFDHEKSSYSESLDLVLPYLKSGGVLIADDVLWKGEVFSTERLDYRVKALRFFLKEILSREDLNSFVCPLGDGVAVVQKV
jgi:predicted O-methyltransferase YrrM